MIPWASRPEESTRQLRRILFGGVGGGSATSDMGLLILRMAAGLSLAFAHGLGKLPPSERFLAEVEERGFPSRLYSGGRRRVRIRRGHSPRPRERAWRGPVEYFHDHSRSPGPTTGSRRSSALSTSVRILKGFGDREFRMFGQQPCRSRATSSVVRWLR